MAGILRGEIMGKLKIKINLTKEQLVDKNYCPKHKKPMTWKTGGDSEVYYFCAKCEGEE